MPGIQIGSIHHTYWIDDLDISGCHEKMTWKIGINNLKEIINASNVNLMHQSFLQWLKVSFQEQCYLTGLPITYAEFWMSNWKLLLQLLQSCMIPNFFNLSYIFQNQVPIFFKSQLLEYNTFLAIIEIRSVVCIKY